MDLVYALRTLRRRWLWIAIGLVPALYLALSTAYHVSTSGLQKKSIEYGAASTQILVDSKRSSLAYASSDLSAFTSRAQIFAQFVQSNPVKAEIGRLMHMSPNSIAVAAPSSAPGLPTSATQQGSAQRNSGLLSEGKGYQITAFSRPNLPIITIYSQGPDAAAAIRLAEAGAKAIKDYVRGLESGQTNAPIGINGLALTEVSIKQLGAATGGMVDSGTSKKIVFMSFFGLLIVDCILVILLSGFVDRWRLRDEVEAAVAAGPEHESSEHDGSEHGGIERGRAALSRSS